MAPVPFPLVGFIPYFYCVHIALLYDDVISRRNCRKLSELSFPTPRRVSRTVGELAVGPRAGQTPSVATSGFCTYMLLIKLKCSI